MANDNGPFRGGSGDPGKGTVTRPPNDGTLWQDEKPAAHEERHGEFTFTDGSGLRGDDKAFGGSTTTSPMDSPAPIWTDGKSTDGNATNRVGGFGAETQSDPMFDRFKHEEDSMTDIDANKGSGSESPDSVASNKLGGTGPDGTKSDPMFERYPSTDSDEDDGGSKTSGGNVNLFDGRA